MIHTHPVIAEWKPSYGWVLIFKLTDGEYERIAVDRPEALRIAKRVLPGVPVEFRGPRGAA